MNDLYSRSAKFLKRKSPTILTCVGAAGVVVTSISTAKAATKASKLLELAKEETRALIQNLKELGVNMVATKKEVNDNADVAGLSFCITGALSLPRKEYELLIEKNGGKNVSGVTSKTSYLVTNDTTSGSSKNKKAQQLGVKIISEEELRQLLKMD